HVVDPIRKGRAKIQGAVAWFGQPGVGVRGAALQEARRVGNRYVHAAMWRLERTNYSDHTVVGNEGVHGCGRDVCAISSALIEDVNREPLATHATLRVRLVDGHLDCVLDCQAQLGAWASVCQLCRNGPRPWRQAPTSTLQKPSTRYRNGNHEYSDNSY